MTKCILVALDGSKCAEQALSYALRLARADETTLEVRSFVDPRTIVGRSLPKPLEERHVAAAMFEAREIVAHAIAKARSVGIRASGRSEIGEPAAEIVNHARVLEAEAIVMGTHGRSGFKRLFMGSIAEEVLRSATCPVIVVREKEALEEAVASPAHVDDGQPISELRLLQVSPANFERLYGEIATFMEGPAADIPGILERELLGSADRTRIVTLVRFHSHEYWIRAQWDQRLSELLEEIVLNSETLEFDLYCSDRFPLKGKRKEPAPSPMRLGSN